MPKCPECDCSIDGFSELTHEFGGGAFDVEIMYYCPECDAILGFSGKDGV